MAKTICHVSYCAKITFHYEGNLRLENYMMRAVKCEMRKLVSWAADEWDLIKAECSCNVMCL